MAQEGKYMKFRLYAAIVFLAACIVLPYTAMALKPLSHNELLNNSAEMETVINNKHYEAANLPEPESTDIKPEDTKFIPLSSFSSFHRSIKHYIGFQL